MGDRSSTPDSRPKQSWAEAVIECVSDKAERERLIRLYDYDELVQACLALGTLALSAKVESARNAQLERELAAARTPVSETTQIAYLRSALEAIAKGSGAFSRDPLTHATNCIENMKAIAKDALNGDYRPDDE